MKLQKDKRYVKRKIPKISAHDKLEAYMMANPEASTRAAAKAIGITPAYAYTLRSLAKKHPKEPEFGRDYSHEFPASDAVHHPAHYKVGGIETIDFIEAKELNYRLGNVVKYITRADHKGDRLENLEKAQWYLTREIDSMLTTK